MRIIFQIAKNELRNLFFSPIAWFVTVVMMAMCAFYYTNIISFTAKMMHLTYKNHPDITLSFFDSFTSGFYLNMQGGFIFTILPHLFLFVPLLTMGVIGREFNNGTIRLLYSSPVKLRNIVLGKFLGMAIYNLLLVSVVGIFMVAGFATIKSLDVPPLLCASLGLYLFFTTLTAIGIFMSSLTTYQVVSAVATFIVLFFLSSIGGLWQQYDFIRDLTSFLSLGGRLEKMILGLLTTKDVLYYLIIMAMFTGFTLLKLKAGQETKPWYLKMSRYMAIVAGALVLGYISSRPRFTGYFDTTATKTNTVHPRTQQLLKKVQRGAVGSNIVYQPLCYSWIIGLSEFPQFLYCRIMGGYQRFKTDIDFKYEYYYALTESTENVLIYIPGKVCRKLWGLTAKLKKVDSAMFKPYEKISKEIDLAPEDYQIVMQLKYRGRSTLVRFYIDSKMLPDQQNMNAAFSRLLEEPIPKVYFVTGNLERSVYKTGERNTLLMRWTRVIVSL